jgi:hypothetical protein
MFYFYANELALKGLRTGGYEDGAIIVEEMLEFQIGERELGRVTRRPDGRDGHTQPLCRYWRLTLRKLRRGEQVKYP